MIDEAADIFLSGNTALKNLAVSSLSMHIRKGRSMKIGFVLSVQSAGDVPAEIRQNLNSVIVYKHKNPSILREILPEQASDVFGVVNNLQRGEALVHMFGVRGLIHANMNRAPFKLYEPNEVAE
jgi:DNA helicase HerA-like ATPase